MKKWQRWLLSFAIALAAVAAIGHVALTRQAHAPAPAARVAQKAATTTNGTLYFGPKQAELTVVVYPGAFVDPGAYSIWAKQVAAAGYRVAIVSFPYDLAVLGANRADRVVRPKQRYVIGGHSLGGVMASRYARAHKDGLAGVFFLASYPDAKGALSSVPVLSLTGSRDGVLDWAAYKKAKADLPADAIYRQLAGGNHAGFGAYGKQAGDKTAHVSNTAQQRWIAAQLVAWLKTLRN
ncbi:alpha/beta hydrolase [Lacticaseibacillus kribbianus]|uniref:alpha/beta hydrolase n=1 Tax=Lacticaseibacillus kribbianus TaxID=2926292 RepID=UPI001CD1B09E|nr:alpha/beta hydrolase [Lacticaseibacillus kribbianus]